MITILHTNDFHGKLSNSKLKSLLTLRETADLYFDCGDGILAGNLGLFTIKDLYWSYLHELQCTASVLGNRETHPIDTFFQKKVNGASHPIICANFMDKENNLIYPPYQIIECKGFKIGIIGAMVPMIEKDQKSAFLSNFLWSDPIETAHRYAKQIRNEVDLLFAITHIGYQEDVKLAKLGLFDLILGGHSHSLIESPTNICQTGSHARFAGIYQFDPVNKRIIEGQLVSI